MAFSTGANIVVLWSFLGYEIISNKIKDSNEITSNSLLQLSPTRGPLYEFYHNATCLQK